MKQTWLILTILICLFCLGCSAWKDKTGGFVTLLEIHEDTMLFQHYDGEQITVYVPKIIKKLVVVDKDYFVEYESYKGKPPQLVSIEPSEP